MKPTTAPKFIPDDQAEQFFGSSTTKAPSFISDDEMNNLSQPKAETFDVPDIESRQQKSARYIAEAKEADEKSKKANSFTGFMKNFGKSLVENVASSEVGLGKTIAKIAGNEEETYKNIAVDQSTTQRNLLKLIREKQMRGEDATKLKQLYNDGEKKLKETQSQLDESIDLPSTGQVVGQLAGTTLDLATAGNFSKAKQGINSFKLARELPSATKLVTGEATGLFSKQGAKKIGTGLGIGYTFDVAQNLQEGDTGSEVFKPGIGTVVGGTLPAIPQAGKTLTPNSESIMQRVGRITPTQQVKFQKMSGGETVGEYLSRRQIFGNEEQIVDKLYKRFVNSKNEADTALDSLEGVYQFKPIKTMIKDLSERESRVSTDGALSKDYNRIQELSKKYKSTGLSMKENNEVKRLFEKNVKLDYLKQNLPEKIDRANNLDSAVRELMVNEADKRGFKNLKQINKETQLARQLADNIGSYAQGRQANNAISLTDAIFLAGGDTTAIAQYLTKKIFSSKRLQSWFAKVARDKGKDIGEIKALFGEATPLPKQLGAGLNVPAYEGKSGIDVQGMEDMAKYYENIRQQNTKRLPPGTPGAIEGETIGLPQKTATGVEASERSAIGESIDSKKQSQLSQELSERQSLSNSSIKEPKELVIRDAELVSEILDEAPKGDKGDLMDVLKANRPQVYREVVEQENASRHNLFNKEYKGSPIGEKMNAKEINSAVNRHIGEAFQVVNDPDMADMIAEDPKGFIKQTLNNIVMGLEKDAPSASEKIAKINTENINTVSQLGSAVEKALNKSDGYVEKILATVKELPDELQQKKEGIDARREYFFNNPLNDLKKYESKKYPGELPEVNNTGKGKFNKMGDQVIDQMYWSDISKNQMDSNDLAEKYSKFMKDKKRYLEEVVQVKKEIAEYKKAYKAELDTIMEASEPTLGTVESLLRKIKNTPNKQGGFIKTGNKDTTVAVHNISAEKLLKADNVGGFVNPSMAIFDADHGFDSFGEISLIGNKNLISKGKTYASDVYSPRYPKVYQEVTTTKPIEAELQKYEKVTGDHVYNLEKDNIVSSLTDNGNTLASFLDSQGIDIPSIKGDDGSVNMWKTRDKMREVIEDKDLREEYRRYVDSLASRLNMKEMLYVGRTPSGKAKMIPNSMENASKVMNKKDQRGGEDFFPNLGNIRSRVAPQLKTFKAIKDAKSALVKKEEFEKIVEQYETQFEEVLDSLKKHAPERKGDNPFIVADERRHAIADYLGGDRNALQYHFGDLPESEIKKLSDLKKSLESMPTEYFETKFNKPVQIPEFKHAVVPDDIDSDALKVLEKNGIKVVKYKAGNIADRQRIIRELRDEGTIDTFGKVKVNPLVGGAVAGAVAVGVNKAVNKKEKED